MPWSTIVETMVRHSCTCKLYKRALSPVHVVVIILAKCVIAIAMATCPSPAFLFPPTYHSSIQTKHQIADGHFFLMESSDSQQESNLLTQEGCHQKRVGA